jgi:hypothetical protein
VLTDFFLVFFFFKKKAFYSCNIPLLETHGEFIEQLSKIEAARKSKITSAERIYDYHVENIMSHYNSEKISLEADFDVRVPAELFFQIQIYSYMMPTHFLA